jgi:hypothetical protein
VEKSVLIRGFRYQSSAVILETLDNLLRLSPQPDFVSKSFHDAESLQEGMLQWTRRDYPLHPYRSYELFLDGKSQGTTASYQEAKKFLSE